MCDCIEHLEKEGFVEQGAVFEVTTQQFRDQSYYLRLYVESGPGQYVASKKAFQLNYCPACGTRLW